MKCGRWWMGMDGGLIPKALLYYLAAMSLCTIYKHAHNNCVLVIVLWTAQLVMFITCLLTIPMKHPSNFPTCP